MFQWFIVPFFVFSVQWLGQQYYKTWYKVFFVSFIMLFKKYICLHVCNAFNKMLNIYLHPMMLSTDKSSWTCHDHSRRSICQTGKSDTRHHCAPFNSSKWWYCPSYSQGTSCNPHPIPISLSSLISKKMLCHSVSLWQFNLIVTIECSWVAKGTISFS